VSFSAITLCVASQRVFIIIFYFVIDSVRKLLDTSLCVLYVRLLLKMYNVITRIQLLFPVIERIYGLRKSFLSRQIDSNILSLQLCKISVPAFKLVIYLGMNLHKTVDEF
jgi:hypothetical protein